MSQVRVEVEKNEYVLCTLRPGKVDQSNLSVFFSEGERVTFRVTGNRYVESPAYALALARPVSAHYLRPTPDKWMACTRMQTTAAST